MENQRINIAILEDDLYFRTDLARSLRKFGITHQSVSLEDYFQLTEKESIDFAFLDLDLTQKNQKEGLKAIEYSLQKNITPIVLTGHEDKETIQKAYELGCAYYFSKLDFQNNYEALVGGILKSVQKDNSSTIFKNDFVTQNDDLKSQVLFALEQSKRSDQNFMLLGPTGVGKTKLAKLIHDQNRKNTPFVHVNLSELSENLIESELFGHAKGAFTGAANDHQGLIEKAHGGTLFLDEIGTLNSNTQKKLLRVIEEKSFSPLGSNKVVKVDFQLITATCDDLPSLIQEGDFRLDLYFRIKGVEIQIPSLSNRREDISLLIDYFIKNSPQKIAFSSEAQEVLKNYNWYGNIRELQNLVKEMLGKAKGLIQVNDLPQNIQENRSPISTHLEDQHSDTLLNKNMRNIIKEEGLPELIKKLEVEAMAEWQERCQGKTNEIIRQLKISKSLFYRIYSDFKSSKTSAKL